MFAQISSITVLFFDFTISDLNPNFRAAMISQLINSKLICNYFK